jgi:glycosyltransferase involved in cell wall biosynthesis
MTLSVITCTYNPRPDQLRRTLEALRAQTLGPALWEHLLVDNASTEKLPADLPLLPSTRLLHEPRPGKAHALLRAISEARGDLLVIADDDNVLAPDYLEQALSIAETKPFLGVWGGQILPEFETPPADWAKPYLFFLTLKEFSRETWSNLHTAPAVAGAGMCLRKSVAQRFAENLETHPERLRLGRTGSSVLTGEDWEMSLAACDLGLGMGHLPQLKLHHLIGARRLELPCLLHLVETMCFSRQVFVHMRGLHELLQYPPTRLQRLARWLKSWKIDSVRRKFLQAEWKAFDEAHHVISQNALAPYAKKEGMKSDALRIR